MSVDLSGEITAIATAVLAVFAIVTAVFAMLAFRKQSKEVSDQADMLGIQSGQLAEQRKINAEQTRVLDLQAKELQESLEQREREARERRSAQASQVFVWEGWQDRYGIGKPPEQTVTAHIHNTSEQPIYDVRFSWHSGDLPLPAHKRGKPLMPGEQDSTLGIVPDGADPAKFGASVIFRDRAKRCWRARPDGQFDELPEGDEPPHSW